MKRLLLLSFLFSLFTFSSNAQWLPCVDAALLTGATCAVVDSVYGCDMVVYNCENDAIYNHGITHFTHDPYPYITSGLACHVDFSISESGGIYSFNDSVGNSISGAPSYLWDFGDGNSSTDAVFTTHSYSTPGYYTVCATIDDGGLCSSKSCRVILVTGGGGCTPLFLATTNCGVTTFTDLSTPTGYSYAEWDLGDGTTATAAPGNYMHSYAVSDTYTVHFQMIDTVNLCNLGYSTDIIVTIPSVAANFSYVASGTGPYAVNFTNTSSGATSYMWDFGDGDTSSAENPVHDYDSCSYSVNLTAIDSNGCISDTLILIDACDISVPTFNSVLNSMSVYPNPAKDNINLVLNSRLNSDVILIVKDVTGRNVVESIPVQLNAGKNNYKLDLPKLPAGVYIIQINDDFGMMNTRVLIK